MLNGIAATREDNYFFVLAGVDVTIRDHVTAGISYQHRENFSAGNSNAFSAGSSGSFNDNQFSARVSLNF